MLGLWSRSMMASSDPLIAAASAGDAATVAQLIEDGAVVDRPDGPIEALVSACAHGHLGTARVLLDLRADVGAVPDRTMEETPLQMATKHPEIVKLLLDRGAKVDLRDTYGVTALHWAADFQHCESARLLVESGADVNAEMDDELHTPLHFATGLHMNGWEASASCIEIVDMLVDAGAEVDAKAVDWVRQEVEYLNVFHPPLVLTLFRNLESVATSKEFRPAWWVAARPWSVMRHRTFGPAVQQRAVLLLVIDRRLAAERLASAGEAFLAWWTEHGVDYVLDPWDTASACSEFQFWFAKFWLRHEQAKALL